MKIVVHGANWIGDAVMSVPALRLLRKRLPEAVITLHTRPWAKGVFGEADFFDNLVTGHGSLLKDAKAWRKAGFDLALLFTNSFRSAMLSFLGGADRRYGYANEGRSLLLTKGFEMPSWRGERHEVYFYLNLVESVLEDLGSPEIKVDEDLDISIPVGPTARERAASELQDARAGKGSLLIGLGVGSQNSRAKRWPAKSYARLAERLVNGFSAEVFILGSREEMGVAQEVCDLAEVKVHNLAGKTELGDAVAILSELDLFVSNDMGLAHVATAVGTKTLTVFGPTNPLTTQPWRGEIVRRDDVDCSPCMLRDCPIDHRCMTRISPGEVLRRVEELIA